jgi:hypothetical protein
MLLQEINEIPWPLIFFCILLKQKQKKAQIQFQYGDGAKDLLFLESKIFFI